MLAEWEFCYTTKKLRTYLSNLISFVLYLSKTLATYFLGFTEILFKRCVIKMATVVDVGKGVWCILIFKQRTKKILFLVPPPPTTPKLSYKIINYGLSFKQIHMNFTAIDRVGTEVAVALWYNTARVSALTHGYLSDASYAQSPSFHLFSWKADCRLLSQLNYLEIRKRLMP
ncbi:Uncharacterized protein APZ42_033649 [Daphnia magna]|uniref:Uncharacterized protein n=1 Tax=Daphnia magna TaxID=35525 RepID=A0A164KWL5_9CRUS|nr:Uncharacterized protein APZ42_033649 [Daphnia magna]